MNDYSCDGPFSYGTSESVCVHGWNTPHFLSSEEAQYSDKLTNCGLLPTRQRIEKVRHPSHDEEQVKIGARRN